MGQSGFFGGLCGGAKGPTEKTKEKFDEFVKWVEANDRLPKKRKNAKDDPAAKIEDNFCQVMARWNEENLGSERFCELERYRRRYVTELKSSYQRLEAWCQENGRLPRWQQGHGGDSESGRDEDIHMRAWNSLMQCEQATLNTAEADLLGRLKRQA